jgi:DNA-binding response OmpR family regulator
LGRESEIAKGLALGADAYISKPFSNTTLVARVKELLEKTYEEAEE